MKALVTLVFLCVCADLSHAAQLWCTGNITNTMMESDGTVMILSSWRNDWTELCTTSGAFGGIPTEVCLSWYATAVKAQTSPRSVTLYFADASTYNCQTLPTYVTSLSVVPNQFIIQ